MLHASAQVFILKVTSLMTL